VQFQADLGKRLDRFRTELATSWQELSVQLQHVQSALAAIDISTLAPRQLESFETCFADFARELLSAPAQSCIKSRFHERTLEAIADLRSDLQDLVHRLPAETTAANGGSPLPVIALRGISSSRVLSGLRKRSELDGELQLLFARAILHLAEPWQMVRRGCLRWLAASLEEPPKLDKYRARWQRRTEEYTRRANELLDEYRQWSESMSEQVRRAATVRRPAYSDARSAEVLDELQKDFEFWARQQRAVSSVLQLELHLVQVASSSLASARAALTSIQQERLELIDEVDSVVRWLETRNTAELATGFPSVQANLLAAEARQEYHFRELDRIVRSELPARIETVKPSRRRVGWTDPWKELAPMEAFSSALGHEPRRICLEGFHEAEFRHRSLVREVERVREVVAFGTEAAREGSAEGIQVAAESISNSMELLRHQRQSLPPIRQLLENSLARSLSAWHLDAVVPLEQGRIGAFATLAQRVSEQGSRELGRATIEAGRRAALLAARGAGNLSNHVLYTLGLKTPPVPPAPAVARTPRLDELRELQAPTSNLPLIYQRLFRLVPVDDPRFLIGRDEELAGLGEARRLWASGKAVSILLIGARGSGKTSFLNVAERAVFRDLEVVRGSLSDRILTSSAMEEFLRRFLKLPPETDLMDSLRAQRRVIVLEEIERAFLRRMDGFEGIRYLLELVSSSWHSTLWLLCLNEAAFRYLELGVGLTRYFSHRLNAMAVNHDDLRNAILLRHNLSGYRLAFAPPPEGDPRISRFRAALGLKRDAEAFFFASIFEQSEGIFRAAFRLWQQHIDRIEGGVVYMRQLLNPGTEPLIASLIADDYFSLQAILQHGGLNCRNMSAVFDETESMSQRRLERLEALGLIEPDPMAAGYRIRPDAGRFVREALNRQNLW
jgi:hypothetical protein